MEKPKRPVIRHTTIHRDQKRLESTIRAFAQHELPKKLDAIIDELPENWQSPDSLLALRKLLQKHTRAATIERDDRVMKYAETGEVTNEGHEVHIAVIAALIHYHIDTRFKQLMDSVW